MGHVIPGTYSLAVKGDALRDEALRKLEDCRGLERLLSVGVEKLLS